MQKRFVEVTDEIRLMIQEDNHGSTMTVIYQGPFGFETSAVGSGKDLNIQEMVGVAQKISRSPTTMQSKRDNQDLARLIYTLFLEQGITRTAHQLHDLGLGIRARYSGDTDQAEPNSLPFPFDRPSQPLSELKYSANGTWYHFHLNPNEDEIAFFTTAKPTAYWTSKEDIGPILTDFAIKRLFEIYKSDTSSFTHLAWIVDLNFVADLGL